MPEILTTPFSGPATWASETLLKNDGLVRLDAACKDELRIIATSLKTQSITAHPASLVPSAYALEACTQLMHEVRHQLDHGIGFSIIDSLPVDDFDHDTTRAIYWLLMNLVGRAVAQTHDGTMIYDVKDTSQRTEAGNGVRASKTSQGQNYHTDNAFNLPPDYVGLLCLQTAAEGGESGLVSFETVYNRLLETRPDVIERLYAPFYFDRQFEHSSSDTRVNTKPMVEYDQDTVSFAFNPRLIGQGYSVMNQEIDPAGAAALSAVREICEAPGMGKRFVFERGQIQIVNNRRLGHRRTAFVDHEQPSARRHLLRIWLRNEGTAAYDGVSI